MKKTNFKKITPPTKTRGFTLLISIVTTSMLLLVSFVIINVTLKQLILAYSGSESQYAFYNADSGAECASYWDLKNGLVSAFDPTTPGTISCNSQTISTGSQTVPTNPTQPSVIGGSSVSLFSINFTKGCAIVRVTKSGGNTLIESRGYNTCVASDRRFERGISISY